MKKLIIFLFVGVFSIGAGVAQAGFSLDKVKNKLDKSSDCKKGDKDCERKEKIKAKAKALGIAATAKLIADIAIEFKSVKISDETKAVNEYKKIHKTLPKEPLASEYLSNAHPGNVIESGKKIAIRSSIVVVPGTKVKTAFIQEKLSIYDNEDHSKELKSLTKPVNEKTKRGGHFRNEFSFKLPVGIPQGVYPVKSTLFLNGKEVEDKKNDLQLVLHIDRLGNGELIARASQLGEN